MTFDEVKVMIDDITSHLEKARAELRIAKEKGKQYRKRFDKPRNKSMLHHQVAMAEESTEIPIKKISEYLNYWEKTLRWRRKEMVRKFFHL